MTLHLKPSSVRSLASRPSRLTVKEVNADWIVRSLTKNNGDPMYHPRCKECSRPMVCFSLPYPFTGGSIWECQWCGFRATDREIEDGALCPMCGDEHAVEGDSLCPSCIEKTREDESSWQITGVPVVACKE